MLSLDISHHPKGIRHTNDYNILNPKMDMVEQQKIDIEEENTTTATSIKKGTKQEQQQQQPSMSEETHQQDNAAGVETKDLD